MKNEFITILRILIKTIKSLSEEEVKALIEDDARLIFQKINFIEKSSTPNIEIESYYNALKVMKTREEMVLFLESLKKAQVMALCTCYQIPFLKRDTKEKLIRKVIDNLLGIRIRFQALDIK